MSISDVGLPYAPGQAISTNVRLGIIGQQIMLV